MSTRIDIDELLWNLESAKDRGVRSVIVYHEHEGAQDIKTTQVAGSNDGDIFMIHTDRAEE